MKILIVDDHSLFRAGLRLLLVSMEPAALILDAATVSEALALAQQHPDLTLCLLDLALHDEHGLDALTVLKATAPDVAVVVVSAASDVESIRDSLDAGAMSFVPKSMPPQELTIALRSVLRGDIYLPQEVLLVTQAVPPSPRLSPRQFDALRGLARGLPTKSIARELNLSEYTVKEYIGTLFKALGVRNRTEAVIAAGRLRLLAPLPHGADP